MNVFNRVLVVIELVVLAILSVLLIALLLLNRAVLQSGIGGLSAGLNAAVMNVQPLVAVAVLLVLLALFLLLIALEFRRPGARRLRLQSVEGIEVLMTSGAITQQLEYALDSMSDILQVRPQVVANPKDESVDVFIELLTTTDVDIKTKTEEAAGVARHVIEDKLGLKVGRVQIKLDQLKAPKRPARPLKPAEGETKVSI